MIGNARRIGFRSSQIALIAIGAAVIGLGVERPAGATAVTYPNPSVCSAQVDNGICITQFSVSYSTTEVALSMTVAHATDPATDNNWNYPYTAAGFRLFIGNAAPPQYSYEAVDYDGYQYQLNGAVQSYSGNTTCNSPTQDVISSVNLSANTYSIRFPAFCIGNPSSFSVQAYYQYGSSASTQIYDNVPGNTPCCTVTPTPNGYWLVGGDGGIFTFGSAHFYGSTGSLPLQRPVVGITPTSDRGGYWLVGSDGGIFAFGDAGFVGSIPGLGLSPAGTPGDAPKLAAPIVGMVPSTTGDGYFLVGSDGGVFAFGDAHFAGSCPGVGGCDAPAVAVMPDATGKGYWLVTSIGSVYAFGDAPYLGGIAPQSVPIVSAVRTPDGGGYWLLQANGSVADFGDALSLGSAPTDTSPNNPAAAIFATSDGSGYWVATANGSVFGYGDAAYEGGMNGNKLNAPIVAATGF
jgi:hypothetical protein